MRQNHLFRFSRQLLVSLAGTLLLAACGAHAQTAAATPTRTTLSQSVDATGTTFSARVQTATGESVTGGAIDFVLANGASVGSASVQPDGTATLTVATLPNGKGITGPLGVAAEYHATEAFADSISPAVALASPADTTQTPDFAVTGNPTTVSTTSGSSATTTLTVSSLGGYTGPVQLSCSRVPAQVTCVFNPTQKILPADGSFTSTVQLTTQAASGPQTASLVGHSGLVLAFLIPGGLLLIGFPGRRRQVFAGARTLGMVLLLIGGGIGLSGCSQRYGYKKHPAPVAVGTPAGSYPIAISVDGNRGSSALEHLITVTLVVQNPPAK